MNFIRFGDIHGPKPCEFIGLGDIHGPKPYEFIGFGDIHFAIFMSKGSRSGGLAKCFLKAWGTKAKQPHMFRKRMVFGLCRLRRQGQKTIRALNNCVFLAWVPQASKKPLGQ